MWSFSSVTEHVGLVRQTSLWTLKAFASSSLQFNHNDNLCDFAHVVHFLFFLHIQFDIISFLLMIRLHFVNPCASSTNVAQKNRVNEQSQRRNPTQHVAIGVRQFPIRSNGQNRSWRWITRMPTTIGPHVTFTLKADTHKSSTRSLWCFYLSFPYNNAYYTLNSVISTPIMSLSTL